ncbi:hypothetical protein [Pedobacter alpinus]|uniref:Uncharacterized protein n=1 Tax=Pedobacter alpinus TaxID=1590643 RepID=A0ABW5TUD5_9SPHI
MEKSPAEKMNDFKDELEAKNPIKKQDLNLDDATGIVPEKKSSYSQSPSDKGRTNKGPIGIDRDPGQV